MPAKSASQKRLMDAAAHNPKFAKKVGIPSKVAKEYSKASKGMTFKQGGEMKESKAMVKKELEFMKKKGAPKSMIKHEKEEAKMASGGMATMKKVAGKAVKGHEKRMHGMAKGGGIEMKGKTKGKMVKMAAGGSVSKRADGVAKKGRTSCKVI